MANQLPIGDGVLRIIADANKGIQQVQEFQRGVKGTFDKLSAAVNVAGSLMFASYAKQAVKALVDIAYAAAQTGSGWKKLSEQTGIAVEQLSAMNYLAIKGETDITSLANGLKFLSKNAYAAATDGGDAAKAFNKLGVSVRDSSGNIKSSHQLLVETANAFKGMKNETERTALAIEIFGRGGMALLPMLKEGGANIQMMEQRARELGITWSTVDARAADELTDAIEDLGLQFKAFKDNALKPVIPEMANFVAGLSAAWREVQNMNAGNRGGLLQKIFTGGEELGAWLLGLNQIEGMLGEIADFGAKNKQYDADVLAATELIQKKSEETGFIHKEINKDLDWRKSVDEHAKDLAVSLKQDIEDRLIVEKEITDELARRNAAQKAAMEAQYYEGSSLKPGQQGPTETYGMGEELGDPKLKFMEVLAAHQALNDKLKEEFEIRYAIKQGIEDSADADIESAEEAAKRRVNAQLSVMGSIAQGMEVMGANSKAMFVFQQMLSIIQMMSDATAGFTKSFAIGGWAGAAVGAAIFARIMVMIQAIKGQKAPEPPKMRVPAAAEGGVVFKPQLIAIAEKEPEIVMPLSRAERAGFIGGGNTKIEVSFKDMADWERNIAVKLVKRARSERLEGWGFAGA